MTPVLLEKYMDAYQRKAEDQLRLMDTANHWLGMYIRTAIGDVLGGKNNYPKKAMSADGLDKKKEDMSPEQMIRMAQRNTAIISGRSRKA